MPEAERALREAEELVDRRHRVAQAGGARSNAGRACYVQLGEHERSIAAFRRQGELYRRAGAELGEYLALGNVGSAQLQAGDVDAAIESLRKAVDGLRRINAPYGQEFRLSYAVAGARFAWR